MRKDTDQENRAAQKTTREHRNTRTKWAPPQVTLIHPMKHTDAKMTSIIEHYSTISHTTAGPS